MAETGNNFSHKTGVVISVPHVNGKVNGMFAISGSEHLFRFMKRKKEHLPLTGRRYNSIKELSKTKKTIRKKVKQSKVSKDELAAPYNGMTGEHDVVLEAICKECLHY
jgi:hypothetical protein